MGVMEDMDMDVNAVMLMLNQTLMLITDMVATEATADMDMAASDDLLLLKHLQLHIMAMEDTADTVVMDMVANADLLKLLQLHITDMVVTEDMVDTDMAAKDDLLSPIMDMEATEDMDTDMDVKLILVNSEKKRNATPFPKSYRMKKLPVQPTFLYLHIKKKKGDF